jgi:AhpD family alkylhydroperoxidase
MKNKSFKQFEELGHCHTVSLDQIHRCQRFLETYETSLDTKTQELIKVALSAASQCEWCISFHVREALKNGASRQDVIEAARMAVLMVGSQALECMDLLRNAVRKFESEQVEKN